MPKKTALNYGQGVDSSKADPEKYREYMERRTASLNETNRRKKSADL